MFSSFTSRRRLRCAAGGVLPDLPFPHALNAAPAPQGTFWHKKTRLEGKQPKRDLLLR